MKIKNDASRRLWAISIPIIVFLSTLIGFTGCKGNGDSPTTPASVSTPDTDTTPDYFIFISQSGSARNSIVTSNPVVIDGINAPSAISISGLNGSYSVNGGEYTNGDGTVSKGDTVTVRLVSSSDFNTSVTMTLVVGGIDHTFTVTTELSDTQPFNFSFTPQTGVPVQTAVVSSSVTVDGINDHAPISISGADGEYSINGGSYTHASGTVNQGDLIRIKLTSSSTCNTAAASVVTIGGVNGGFSVTTSPCVSPVIFQDNFNTYTSGWTPSDTSPAHHVAGGTVQNPGKKEPLNWTGWIRYGNASITIDPTAGRSGTPCLKIVPSWPQSQSEQVGLVKYLGANGYDELYIRYWTKFDQTYQWGNGQNGSFSFYKILRIWQGVTDSEVAGTSGNLASELGRGAIVAGYYEDEWATFAPYWAVGAMRNSTGQTVNCTTDGVCDVFYYYPYSGASDGGHLAGHWGPINASGYFSDSQIWHSVEMHIKLASTFNGTDGISEVWFDGVKQIDFTWVSAPGYAGVPRSQDKFPTARVGNGINYITLNDNQTGTNSWTSAHAVYYDDVVVSTSYIGPD